MRYVMKLAFVFALAAAGCGSSTPAGPDASTSKKPDTGVACSTALCGGACCGSDQTCVTGVCKTCGCNGKVCDFDDCGLPCGTCTAPTSCNSAGQCVNKCASVTCTTSGEICDVADGVCKCTGTAGTQGSCAVNKVCSASFKCVDAGDLCATKVCTGKTPTCTVTGGVATCICNSTPTDSCGTGFQCNAGTCVAVVDKCATVNCNQGETCDAADGLCKCTGSPAQGTCPLNQVCSATNRCIASTDPCATKVCTGTTPVCSAGNCICSQYSCGAGMKCDATSHACVTACSPACTGTTPTCDTSGASPICKCTGVGTQGSCDATYTCQADGSCQPAASCSASNCASGCCVGTTCMTKSAANCGINGATCAACGATADTCSASGTCVCGSTGSACSTGTCNGGTCGTATCTASNCASGCCSGTTCQTPKSTTNCGINGVACTACNMAQADNCNASGTCACGTNAACTGALSCVSGNCVTTNCSPSCVSGEVCQGTTCVCTVGSALGDPTNVPDSCVAATAGDLFYCDPGTHRCKTTQVMCGTTKCAPGQVCQDMSKINGTATVDLQCSCTPGLTNPDGSQFSPETCTIIGQLCDMSVDDVNAGTAQPSTCKKTGEFYYCAPWAGCDTGLTCSTLTLSSGSKDVCVQLCSGSTANCPSLGTTCQSKYGVSLCYDNLCTTYFGACNAAGTADGMCVPLPDDNAGTAVTVGICYQIGTSTGICDPFAERGAAATNICPQGSFCQLVQEKLPSTTPKSYQGLCRPMCNVAASPTPVKACTGTGILCGNYTNYWGGIPTGHTGADYHALPGLCETKCNPLVANTCTTETVLNNPQGCQDYDGTNGICVALMPGAKAVGVACGASTDLRKECQANLFCDDQYTSSSKTCATYCNTTTCPPTATTACTSCQPTTNQVCYPACFPDGFDFGAGNSQYCTGCCSGACTTATSTICKTGGTMPVVGTCLP